jgi:hypothetical protein
MNEQLRQFERESKLEIFGLGARRDKWEAALTKYAELIIQESCQVLLNWKDEPFPFDENLAVRLLKEHFGVEE